MFYKFLQSIIRLGLRLYYAEIKVLHHEYLQHDGPKIIIANHPNTLIDAWLIGTQLGEPAYFIAKGVFFDSEFKKKFLRSLNMIPINRAGEARTVGVSNMDTFEECYRLLNEGKTVVIFPEGNSTMELKLRELKSGTARIALEAENRVDGKLNLKVIPVGLLYTQGEKFRSKILIQAGQGMRVNMFLSEYVDNPSLASKKLTQKFRSMLEKVLVTTQDGEQEQLILRLEKSLKSKYRDKTYDVTEDLQFTKKIRDRIELLQLVEPWKINAIQRQLVEVEWKLGQMEIKSDFLDRRFRSRMFLRQLLFSFIGLMVGFPIFIYGFVHNFTPYYLTDLLVPKMTKDKEYFAPLGILLGLVLYPMTYIGFLFLGHHFFDLNWWQLMIYFVTMPLSGMLAHGLARYTTHVSEKIKYMFMMFNNKDAVVELKKKRDELYDMVFEN